MNRRTRLASAILLAQSLGVTSVAAQVVGSGTLEVRVTRGGAVVAGATVCVGVTGDLNQFFQGTTDALGLASVHGVPSVPFVVTANAQGDGARASFTPPVSLSFFIAPIALPVSTFSKGAVAPRIVDLTCPTTPAGPNRALLPPNIQFTPTPLTGTAPVSLTKREFCFGALGAGCGEPQTGIPATALCGNGVCAINGGSWVHDECCSAFSQGMACRLGPLDAVTGNDGHCVNEWNKAVRLISKGIFWTRTVDFTRANATGIVEFALYCAPPATLLSPEDVNRCCSGISRALTVAEAAASVRTLEALRACQ